MLGVRYLSEFGWLGERGLGFHTPAPAGYWVGAGDVSSWALPCKKKETPVADRQISEESHVCRLLEASAHRSQERGAQKPSKGSQGGAEWYPDNVYYIYLPNSRNGVAILLVAQASNPGDFLDLLFLSHPYPVLVLGQSCCWQYLY